MRIEWTQRIQAGDPANVSRLVGDVHTGTHVDAPLHFLDGGRSVDALDLDALIGPATVVDLPDVDDITAAVLAAAPIPPGARRLLFRTRNSQRWARDGSEFSREYVALTVDAARWVVERGIRLLGVDYLSVQRFHDPPTTHQVLLAAGVVIVEGLDLSSAPAGDHEVICLPLLLVGAEGAPARVVLRPLTPEGQ
jgi:arylformamidase